MGMRRLLELTTAAVGLAACALVLSLDGAPPWSVVLAFGAFLVFAENPAVMVHAGTAISPGFMIVMAAISVSDSGNPYATAALVGACNGIFLPYLRQRRF